jgi:hypothetical protein
MTRLWTSVRNGSSAGPPTSSTNSVRAGSSATSSPRRGPVDSARAATAETAAMATERTARIHPCSPPRGRTGMAIPDPRPTGTEVVHERRPLHCRFILTHRDPPAPRSGDGRTRRSVRARPAPLPQRLAPEVLADLSAAVLLPLRRAPHSSPRPRRSSSVVRSTRSAPLELGQMEERTAFARAASRRSDRKLGA